MKQQLYYLLLSVLVMSSLRQPMVAQEAERPLAYQAGEEIVYVAYYSLGMLWIPAGEVKFVVSETDSTFNFDVIGKSFSSYDSVFKVRDLYHARVDKETMLPDVFMRDIMEGNYVRFDSIAFDQSHFSLVEYFGKSRETAKRFDFALDKVVHDIVSAIYYLRSTPQALLDKEDDIPVIFFFDKELFNLHIHNKGKTRKKIRDMGKVEVYHLQPELITGTVFEEDSMMDIYVSADDNRLPLLIESSIAVGSIKVILSSVKGLKQEKKYLENY